MENKEKIGFTGVDHPALAAVDVEALASWYCEVIGYTRWYRHDKAGQPVWMLQAPDGTLLEIMPKDETERQNRTTWTPGWSHVAFRVSNLDRAMEWLDRNEVNWGGNVATAIGGGRVRNGFDPEGNMFQVLERG